MIAFQLCLSLLFPTCLGKAEEAPSLPLADACTLCFDPLDEGHGLSVRDAAGAVIFQTAQPAKLTVAQGVAMKAAHYRKAYDRVERQGNGLLASATITTDNGSVFTVEDAYTPVQHGIAVSRRVEVLEASPKDKGFQSEFSLAVHPALAREYSEAEYFIPSLLYKSCDNVTERAAFSAEAFQHEKNLVRETRSGLPMVMMREVSTGVTLSIAHIASGIADPVTALSAAASTRVDAACQCGAIGLSNEIGASPAVCFVYPYLETPVVYGSTATKEVCYHPVAAGAVDCYDLLLCAAATADYNDAMIRFYRENYLAQPVEICDIDTDHLYDVCVQDLKSLYTRNGLGCGMPFAVYVDDGSPFAVNFQMGFIGMQITLAHHMIRYGILHQDEELYRQGVSMVDFWSKMAKTDSGVVKVWFDSVSFRPYPPFLRIMTDGMEGMLDAYLAVTAAQRQDANTAAWLDMITRYADFLVREQNADGSFYRCYDYQGHAFQPSNTDGLIGDRNTFGDSRLNTAIPVRFLVRMYEMTQEQSYLDAAKKAGRFVLESLYPTGQYVGGTPDNPNTVDKEAGIYAMYAYSALYAATADPVYLKAMEQAAVYCMSWVYTYQFPVMNLNHLVAGVPLEMGRNDGLSFIATGHSAVDSLIAFLYYDMFKLYVWTGDEVYRDMALFLEKNTKQTMNLGNQYGFAKESLMIEATNIASFRFSTAETRGVWLPWITCANIEPICSMERTFGARSVAALSHLDRETLLSLLSAYGCGGKAYSFGTP